MIPYPLSEIADRYSICKLKSERTSENMTNELKLYEEELNKHDGIYFYVEKLYKINGEIWDLEALIRQGREGELGIEEVGHRALEIRNKNGVRISIKNEITDKYNIGFKEVKVSHASSKD